MPCLPRPLALVLLALPLTSLARGDTPAATFGFGPMEVYKIASNGANLSVGDANGDKIPDLFVSNHEKVKVEVLVQRKPGEPAVKETTEGPNHPGSDARFKREGIPLPRKAVGLVTGDWNGDGLTDVAYYTDPPELRIQLRTASGWSEPAIHPVREGHLHAGSLSSADVTGDGKPDILVLGKGKLFLLPWKSPGVFGAPTVMPLTEDDFWYCYPRDVSGDGRLDLVFMKSETETPVRIRIGTPTGFRPEVAPDLGPCRAVDVADIGRGRGDEILFVELRTGRLRVLSYGEGPAKGLGSPQFLPLPLAKAKERSVSVGDVDGDGRNDILVAEQKGSQLSVFRQDSSGTFSRWEEFPTLSGVTATQIGDVTGDGAADVVVLSPVERAVGVHEWRDGRLQFPRVLPGIAVEGKPAACALVDADGAGPLDLAVAVEIEPKEAE
ncbi:MAG: VCBS repeat-containing protein, partial [Planctomycetales bacterium]|nr:VCBS repeat-containing protein [Planctomycetales bacterium]